ncbi:MAG: fatty acid desaturase [Gammaproteobacteria bacterium]|nr:fatty acid desaturase [Gammaproteobacteria bacterium]
MVFKNSADRIPVLIILALSVLDFSLYLLVDNLYLLGIYFYVMLIPKSQICAWNHHHQHTPTFLHTPLNRILEFFYALHTGVTTNLWVLHHVLGHHHNYLDQKVDQSRWQRKNGKVMGELEYSLMITVTAYYRGFQVGRKNPKEMRAFLLYSAITFIILAGLVVYRPGPAILLFILPMIMGLFMTAWATYEHHAGLNTDNLYEASFNNQNKWYNLFTGNLGYHTAHHYKQGLHWSKLPQLHTKIEHNIPEPLLRKTWV